MSKPAARRERRGADRPFNGDVVVCPRCSTVSLEFNTRWRISLNTGGYTTVPAWVCDDAHCRFFRLARCEDEVLKLAVFVSSAARELRARAQRQLMKSRAARQRAERIIVKSQSRRSKT
jgi:hypothetical protein